MSKQHLHHITKNINFKNRVVVAPMTVVEQIMKAMCQLMIYMVCIMSNVHQQV
jgi:2,4-dienoyl-CoA reductase-like NADH-dependent reductase (Old Yellow Enzyme family)